MVLGSQKQVVIIFFPCFVGGWNIIYIDDFVITVYLFIYVFLNNRYLI